MKAIVRNDGEDKEEFTTVEIGTNLFRDNLSEAKFNGDLKEVIINATDEHLYNLLDKLNYTDPNNIDRLLDFLYMEDALDGIMLDPEDIDKLIPAIEEHCTFTEYDPDLQDTEGV